MQLLIIWCCTKFDFGFHVGKAVKRGECEIVSFYGYRHWHFHQYNKVIGVSAVVCSEPYFAKLSRKHNDTNVLAFGGMVVGVEINLYGLSYDCPYRMRKNNCPLKCIDSLSFPEKFDWIDDLSEERKRSIWEQHMVCFQIRNCKSFNVIIRMWLNNKFG